jgi:hypothetical protein
MKQCGESWERYGRNSAGGGHVDAGGAVGVSGDDDRGDNANVFDMQV